MSIMSIDTSVYLRPLKEGYEVVTDTDGDYPRVAIKYIQNIEDIPLHSAVETVKYIWNNMDAEDDQSSTPYSDFQTIRCDLYNVIIGRRWCYVYHNEKGSNISDDCCLIEDLIPDAEKWSEQMTPVFQAYEKQRSEYYRSLNG